MKRYIGLFLLTLCCIPALVSAERPTEASASSSYDIVGIYKGEELDYGSKVIDSYGNVEEAEMVLVPARYDLGRQEVELTRVDTDYYRICGTSYYIETRYCYEYATREDVIINITSNYGYTRGEVIFF